jgi:hypothetical protein
VIDIETDYAGRVLAQEPSSSIGVETKIDASGPAPTQRGVPARRLGGDKQ